MYHEKGEGGDEPGNLKMFFLCILTKNFAVKHSVKRWRFMLPLTKSAAP
jgi:hypothetical protein